MKNFLLTFLLGGKTTDNKRQNNSRLSQLRKYFIPFRRLRSDVTAEEENVGIKAA